MAKSEFTDAIALLKADHRTVEDLFEKFEKAGSDRKQALAAQICDELQIHTMLEEEIFYPALEGEVDEDDLKEAYVEHDAAKVLINEIIGGDPDSEFFGAKVKVLSELIEHHVEEEEEAGKGIFAQARDADVDLVEMRDRMLARKQSLQKEAADGGMPEAEFTVINP